MGLLQERCMDKKKVQPTVSLDQPSPCFALAQALSGHGVFAAYLYRFKRQETPKCPCGYIEEMPEHLFTQCAVYQLGRPATPVSAANQEWRLYLRDTVCELWRKEQPCWQNSVFFGSHLRRKNNSRMRQKHPLRPTAYRLYLPRCKKICGNLQRKNYAVICSTWLSAATNSRMNSATCGSRVMI